MAIFAKPEATGGSFRLFKDEIGDEVCPEGQHVAVCKDIREEYGVKVQKFQSEETEIQDRIGFLFEVTTEDGKSLIDSAKLGIFLASMYSAGAGLALLMWSPARGEHPQTDRS